MFQATTGAVATTTSARTIFLIRAVSKTVVLRMVSVSFGGTATTDAPIVVELVAGQTNDGTTTSHSTIGNTDIGGTEAAVSVLFRTATVEPTGGTTLHEMYLLPVSGGYVWTTDVERGFQLPSIRSGATNPRFGVRVTAVTATVNCRVGFGWDEA